MDLRELVIAYGEAVATIVNEGETGTMHATTVAAVEADRLLGELDRRLALASTDHHIMWRSHLDEQPTSVRRQVSLLRTADKDRADGMLPSLAVKYIRADLVETHREAGRNDDAVGGVGE